MTNGDNDDQIRRLKERREAELKRIQEETANSRKSKMKSLIGEQAESVGDRKNHVQDHYEEWKHKGQNMDAPDEVNEVIHTDAMESAKSGYEESVEKYSVKGREHLLGKGSNSNHDSVSSGLQERFQGSGLGPSIFDYDPVEDSKTPPTKKKPSLSKRLGLSPPAAVKDKQDPAAAAKLVAAMTTLRPPDWDGGTYHSLVDLRQRKVTGIDMKNREQYLSPADFEEAFGMTKEEFALAPKWKRDKLKAGLHLF